MTAREGNFPLQLALGHAIDDCWKIETAHCRENLLNFLNLIEREQASLVDLFGKTVLSIVFFGILKKFLHLDMERV